MLVEITKSKKGGKELKIDGNKIECCAGIDIYESPGELTRVVITLADVDVKIKNQTNITD